MSRPDTASGGWEGPYSTYVHRLGGSPEDGFEPLLEALPYGAYVVDVLGRILCVNSRHATLTGIVRGMTLEEVVELCEIHDLSGRSLTEDDLPEAQVLLDGSLAAQAALRMRGRSGSPAFVVADSRPVFGPEGRVIGAVTVAREVSEEVALAMEVRRVSEEARAEYRDPITV